MDNIKCPHCGYVYDHCEECEGFVTYWGDDGPKDEDCPNCGAKLKIDEIVTRFWEVELVEPGEPELKQETEDENESS